MPEAMIIEDWSSGFCTLTELEEEKWGKRGEEERREIFKNKVMNNTEEILIH